MVKKVQLVVIFGNIKVIYNNNMKHLNTYKIFESNQGILQDIKDILLELSDNGLLYRLVDKNGLPVIDNFNEVYIYIDNGYRYFEFNKDVKETILRLYQYMRELGFKAELLTNFGIAVKNFVIRPDEGFRYLDGVWIDDNHNVINIRLCFYKNALQYM